MEGKDLVLTGKTFTGRKAKERHRPMVAANWLPPRLNIPTTGVEPGGVSATTRRHSKDKTSVKNNRPYSASFPVRKLSNTTRPPAGLAAPGEHTARESKHSARIDLRTTQVVSNNMSVAAVSEPNLLSENVSDKVKYLEHQTLENKATHSVDRNTTTHKDSNEDIRTLSAVKIQRWYRRLRAGRLKSSHKLVQGLLQQKKEDLNKSRIAELEKVEAQAREMSQIEMEQQKRRALKAQKARQAAIESLKLKREERKQEVKKIAEQEMLMLQSNGKVQRKKVRPTSKSTKQRATSIALVSTGTQDSRNGTFPNGGEFPSSLPLEVEQIFEANAQPRQLKSPPAADAEKGISPNDRNESNQSSHPASSTYDELLDALKLLEEDPEPLKQPANGYLSAENLHRLDQKGVSGSSKSATRFADDPNPTSSTQLVGLNESKMQSILSFLDEMEKVDNDTTTASQLASVERQTRGLPSNSLLGQSTNVDNADAVAADVTTTIMSQRLELEDKNKSIVMLQKALGQQRELTVYHSKEHEKESERRLALQKQEYETTIQRHLSFIDQLIDDKKVLSEKCEKLVKEVKELDKKSSQKVKSLEEKHTQELSKQKEVSAATEKLRRERWMAEHGKKIKEMTVKGLEPEIQRLIAKHKAEVQKIKVLHEAELLQADERASRRFIQQTEELRVQLSSEKETACAHERELAKQRYEKMAEQEEMANQQQRKRLYQEVQLEKERLATSHQQRHREMEEQLANMGSASNTAMAELKMEHERVLGELQRRHMTELKDLREKLQIEKEAWEQNFMKKQDAALVAKQREVQEQLRQQRDKEIEMVIGRLEEESTAAREECDRNAEARIKRIRDKYEAELKEVERSERSTMEKFNTMKEELVVAQGEATRLRSLVRQREADVEQINGVVSKLNRERENISDIVRQEFADRLVFTEEENKSLKTELSELRARHKLELEKVRKDKEKEMEQVHERVKQAVAKKEEAMKSLRTQHEAALKRADHLEMLLERQRQELLKK